MQRSLLKGLKGIQQERGGMARRKSNNWTEARYYTLMRGGSWEVAKRRRSPRRGTRQRIPDRTWQGSAQAGRGHRCWTAGGAEGKLSVGGGEGGRRLHGVEEPVKGGRGQWGACSNDPCPTRYGASVRTERRNRCSAEDKDRDPGGGGRGPPC